MRGLFTTKDIMQKTDRDGQLLPRQCQHDRNSETLVSGVGQSFPNQLQEIKEESQPRNSSDLLDYQQDPLRVNTISGKPYNLFECPVYGALIFDAK